MAEVVVVHFMLELIWFLMHASQIEVLSKEYMNKMANNLAVQFCCYSTKYELYEYEFSRCTPLRSM